MNFFVFIQLLIVSVIATSAMTLFSYIISKKFRELYKEPVLLSFVLTKLNLELSDKAKKILGWLLHYLIGFAFVVAYHILWNQGILSLSILSALTLGIISGLIGIVSWIFLFRISDHQPSIDFQGYYLQLFFAHIIFALTATLTYYLSLTILILTRSYVTI